MSNPLLLKIFRLFNKKNEGTPFPIRSCGHFSVSEGFSEPAIKKPFFELFWVYEGRLNFVWNDKTVSINESEGFYYIPNESHNFYPEGKCTSYRWFTIDGSKSSKVASLFSLPENRVFKGKVPHQDFSDLEKTLTQSTPSSSIIASQIVFRILCLASRNNNTINTESATKMERLLEAIKDNYLRKDFSLESFAKKQGVHRATIYRWFKNTYQMSPKDYILSLKTKEAISLLRSTKLTLEEIALRTGFSDASHLTRSIKKTTGESSKEIRRSP